MELHPRIVFNEPSGRRTGLIFLSLSTICLFGWVYFGVVLDGPHIFLFLSLALAFSGFAESLPTDQRRLAGSLRIIAIGVLLGFMILLELAPELVMG